MLTQQEIDTLVARIVARLRPQKVILFGSYAKGRATSRSDLDLFIVQETTLPCANRADSVKSLLANMLVPVDIHVYTPVEVEDYSEDPFSFVRSVLASGTTLFEKLE